MKNGIVLLFLLTCFPLSSQDLTITNQNSTKSIKQTDLLEIRLSDIDDHKNRCCTYKRFEGKILGTSPDSIEMIINWMVITRDFKSKNPQYDLKLGMSDTLSFAKQEVYSISYYKSEKNKKFRDNMFRTGAILFLGGAFTAANSLIFQTNRSRDLLIASGAQMGAGIVLSLGFMRKNYYFKSIKYPWKIN